MAEGHKDSEHYEQAFKRNEKIINESGIPYRPSCYNGNSIVFQFRDPEKPTVDFYPFTGKWRIHKHHKPVTMKGGAKAFVKWYSKIRRH